ncbi:MAG TPA: DMT family transporter [bacterium]|nr:DMT family transporter [bacterium]
MKHSRHELTGISLMLQASFSFSVMALCVKIASQSLPSLEIVFFRSLFGSLMVGAVMIHRKISFLGKERKIMALRGISGFIALTLHFYTIANLHLGTAVMLNYTAPIFAAILAILFLKERPGVLLLSMIGLAFFGVYLLVEARLTEWNWFVFLAILSAIFAAVAYVSIRAIRHPESPFTIIFYFTAISTLGSLFFLPFGFKWPDTAGWLALGGVAVGSFFGQWGMTSALRMARASLISPFSYLTPLLSFFYGFLLWGEALKLTTLLGAFLIILAGSLISYFETKAMGRKPRLPAEIE